MEEKTSADQLLVIEQPANERSGGQTPAPGERPATQGSLRAQKVTGEPLGDFPLQHTEVEAFVSGYLARTVVTQTYANPYKEVIEAVYVFPLGSMAAVHDFVMEVGKRRIVGIVRPREEAERIYREARARGQTASLLTQERPNIFTQNVANIEPGGSVTITITTFEHLAMRRARTNMSFRWWWGRGTSPARHTGSPRRTSPPAAADGRRPPAPSLMPIKSLHPVSSPASAAATTSG